MSSTAEKAREHRLKRLRASLDGHLDRPEQALETLLSELELGERRSDLWEGLHAAAARDGQEADLTRAYETITVERKLRKFSASNRGLVLTHAADFFQGVLGDADTAERILWRVLEQVPDHADAFARLERRFKASRSRVRLAELYALVASKPPRPAAEIAKAALSVISVLPSESVLPDEACLNLLVLVPANDSLLDVLEKHCRKTGRFALTCKLLERSLEIAPATEHGVVERRYRLIELYMGEAGMPEKAMDHVELLLEQNPGDETARPAAERLLQVPEVAARAATALRTARRRLR